MRVWAEVYDEAGVKTGSGPVSAIKSASVTEQLDGAGTFNLDLGTDERVLAQLVNEAEARVMVQPFDFMTASEWVRGIVRDNAISDAEGGTQVSVSGPDVLETLTERTVGIGRSYDEQPIGEIIDDLVSIVPGWTVSVDPAVASDLQSSRFDGVNVLQALRRTTEEKGIHFRRGASPNTLEVGAFGDYAVSPTGSRVRAIKPPSVIGYELYDNDAVLLIDKISQSTKSSDVVNWCIPIGAGTGSAALTLRDTTYAIYNEDGTLYRGGTSSKYPIYRRVNTSGIIEYYIAASVGARQRQAVVTFKQIGPVANSLAAKRAAANMLVDAAIAYLDRQKTALVTYKFSAKNVQADIRPGNLLPIWYSGKVEVLDETRTRSPHFTYMDVNEPLWVMKVTKRIGDGDIDYEFELATVDRYEMDTTRIVVSMLEALQVQNLSVQTIPMVFPFVAYDTMQEGTSFGSGYNKGKKARMDLRINDYITDVWKVELHFITLPLHITGRNLFSSPNYWTVFDVVTSSEYPSGISLFIDDVDVSASVVDADSGDPGPWNAGSNSQTDRRIDISPYIVDDPGGIYQNFKIELHCEHRLGDISLGSPDPPQSGSNASKGFAFMVVYVFGSMRATVRV